MRTTPRPRARARVLKERPFHAWLARRLRTGPASLLPVGDDAAALRVPAGACLVASTDTLVEGSHFLRSTPAELIGRAAVAVGLSDLAAKGAAPAGVLLAVAVPGGTDERWARRLVLGAERLAQRFDAHVVGGDTKRSPVRTVVGTVVGWGRAGRLADRTHGQPGDLLVTTGTVGRGGAAARGLRAGGPRRDLAVRRLLAIRPRVAEGRALATFAHAMLDTSDGLAEGTRLLAGASRLRAVVDDRLLPWEASLRAVPPGPRLRLALYGGDYELLAAVPPGRLAAARRAVGRLGTPLTAIGTLGPGRGAFLRQGPRVVRMPPAGWRTFPDPEDAGP